MTRAVRLFVPLLMRGCQCGVTHWAARPPVHRRPLWPLQLQALGYAPETTIQQLWIWQPGSGERSSLLPGPIAASAFDPNRIDLPELPRPWLPCRVGVSINARVTGPLRRLTVVCTDLEGVELADCA